MKRISLILCMITVALGLSSCDTYVSGGGYAGRPAYRPGYAYNPGYVRPGYARPHPSHNPHYHSPSHRYQSSSYRGRDWDGHRSYRNTGARSNTRVNVGPVGVRTSNYLRL